ncbi:MAG: hypothetical protein QT08_C0015G0036 [archaeon GW2011_AR17]|nr:MAG: hypothetical protein QT08_C0015G0036 [archaeon GW2011_AR17]
MVNIIIKGLGIIILGFIVISIISALSFSESRTKNSEIYDSGMEQSVDNLKDSANDLFNLGFLALILSVIFGIILYKFNKKYWQYETNWRFWIGIVFISFGFFGILEYILDEASLIVITISITLGLLIWLVKAKKVNQRKKK